MRFIVGGRPLELTAEQVIQAMAGVHPEPFREHIVQLRETVFPPKQVLAVVTGWDRLSFTTMEAQRVLSKLGFVCQRAGTLDDGRGAWLARQLRTGHWTSGSRLSKLDSQRRKLQSLGFTLDYASWRTEDRALRSRRSSVPAPAAGLLAASSP